MIVRHPPQLISTTTDNVRHPPQQTSTGPKGPTDKHPWSPSSKFGYKSPVHAETLLKASGEEGPREKKEFEAKTWKSNCSRRCPWVASARKLPPRNEDADTRPIAFAIYGMKLFYCAAPKTSHNYTSSPGVGS